MHTWWTGLAEAPPDEAQALHALGLGFMAARTLHVALELQDDSEAHQVLHIS